MRVAWQIAKMALSVILILLTVGMWLSEHNTSHGQSLSYKAGFYVTSGAILICAVALFWTSLRKLRSGN